LKKIFCCVVAVLLFFYGLSFATKPLKTIYGKVVKVIDGNTVVMRQFKNDKGDLEEADTRIRLYGIYAPELDQNLGKEAKNYLRDKLSFSDLLDVYEKKPLFINDNDRNNIRADVYDIDKYGRLVCLIYHYDITRNRNGYYDSRQKLFIGILDSINEWLVAEGYAWVYEKYYKIDDPDIKKICLLQETAKKCSVGIWKEDNPTPPWEFRKQKIEKKWDKEANPAPL
jgi:endonuclease YncB( thermonuclease family)